MADQNPAMVLDKEICVKKLKRCFDSWREVVVFSKSVLLWEKRPYPWILVIVPTLLFLKLVYYSPSFLTTVSLLWLLVTVLDYVGPHISGAIWKQDSWSAVKERELEDICRTLADTFIGVKYMWHTVRDMRTNRPNLYYPAAICCLAILAWIGNCVHNLLITYFIVLQLLLLPGLVHYGMLDKVYKNGMLYVANFLHSLSTPTKKIQ